MGAPVTYTEAPASAEAIGYVLEHLWSRGREELVRLGIDRADAPAYFAMLAGKGQSGALLADGEPILVAGICPEPGGFFTWFQATDKFDEHALHITRRMRAVARAHPQPVRVYSVLCHPLAERWFKAMGFVRDGWRGATTAGHPLYRFEVR